MVNVCAHSMEICRTRFRATLGICELTFVLPGEEYCPFRPLPDINAKDPLIVGQLIIQFPSAYVSDHRGIASYGGHSISCGFVPQRFALQNCVSYAGVDHCFGPIRSGVQVFLVYDIVVTPGNIGDRLLLSSLRLHDSVGAVAPITTQLISQLGHWFERPETESHLIYSLGTVTNAEYSDHVDTVTSALLHTNQWLQQLPSLILADLRALSFPVPIAYLIANYLPSDFYKGFYWYRCFTSFRKYGDNSDMKFEYTSDDKEPFFMKPSSIHVSSSMDECLDASFVGKQVKLSRKNSVTAIVILPVSRLMALMTRSSRRLLNESMSLDHPFPDDNKQTFVLSLLRCNFNVASSISELQRLLELTIANIPVRATEWGKKAIRDFIETTVYRQRFYVLGEAFADFLRATTATFVDGRLHDATATFQIADSLIRFDADSPVSRNLALKFVRRLYQQLDADTRVVGYSFANEKRLLQHTLLRSLPLYVREFEVGRPILDFQSMWSLALEYDASASITCVTSAAVTSPASISGSSVAEISQSRESGVSMVMAFYRKLLLQCEFNHLLEGCTEIAKMPEPDFRILELLQLGIEKIRAYPLKTGESILVMVRLETVLEKAGFPLPSWSADVKNDLAPASSSQATLNGMQVIEIDADAEAPRPKRKATEPDSPSSVAAASSSAGPKRCKPNFLE